MSELMTNVIATVMVVSSIVFFEERKNLANESNASSISPPPAFTYSRRYTSASINAEEHLFSLRSRICAFFSC